jgi:hypothetical protein
MFAGLVENAFYGEIGLADPALAGYLAELLSRFVRMDEIYPPSKLTGRRIEGVVQMLEEAAEPQGADGLAEERRLHRHIGDFTLFWTGLFPEMVRFHASRIGGQRDALLDYVTHGKRSYLTASRLSRQGLDQPPRELLQRLSTHYELCLRAMDLIRRQWRPQRVSFDRSAKLLTE